MFAITPRNLLNEHRIASATINAAHRVQQKDEETPERNKLEAPLGEMIVAGTRLVAARTNSGRARARTHRDLNQTGRRDHWRGRGSHNTGVFKMGEDTSSASRASVAG